MHLNIGSAPKNLTKLQLYLKTLDVKFSLIAVTETWFNENNHDLYGMDEYQMVDDYRKSQKGGGIAFYIHNSIVFKERNDLDVFNDNIESKFIEIDKSNFGTAKHILAGVIYRPPNTDLSEFNSIIGNITTRMSKENKECYLLGDWNINLLNVNNHTTTSEFVECMFSEMFIPLINRPTRVQERSATLIDNIFTNCINFSECIAVIMCTDISDHFPIFFIDCRETCNSKDESVTRRIYSQRNIEKFTPRKEYFSIRAEYCKRDTSI